MSQLRGNSLRRIPPQPGPRIATINFRKLAPQKPFARCPLPRLRYSFSEEEESCNISDNDCFTVSLRLQETRLELNSAVAAENWEQAAKLRDHLQALELVHRSLTIAQNKQEDVLFTVGTTMRHRVYGYRGVIVGYDQECLAPQSWKDAMKVNLLAYGANQPFYHILVDVRDRPGAQTTYVAQENVVPSRKPHHVNHPLVTRYLQILRDKDGKSWSYLPTAELRELYKDDF